MKRITKTKTELLKEFEETQKKVQELEICRAEYEKAKENYEKLLDSTPDAMLFVNARNQITIVNAQFERIFGYKQEEIVGKTLDILVPDRYNKTHRKQVKEFFRHPKMRPMGSHYEIYARRKDGSEFPADINLSPLQTEDEFLITAAVRDVTRRKEAEEQIELNYAIQKVINSMLKVSLEELSLEEQFDRILDLILNVPHLSLQSKGAIFLNVPYEEILIIKAQHGFSKAEPLPCTEIPIGHCLCGKAAAMSKLLYAEDMDPIHEIHAENMFPHGHYCVPILSGNKVYGLLNVYLKKGHKRDRREEDFLTAVASTLATIIERDRADNEKKELQLQLAQTEKLAALGRFTANIAHEIRNPLTSVGGFARRLDKAVPADRKEKEYTKIIIAEVTRLEKILKNILSFSKESSPNITENNLAEAIERVLFLHGDLFREKSVYVVRSLGYIPSFAFDLDLIIEALENIFLNALDSMDEGGTLTIFTGREEKSGK
ncbi:MAG: PAS domain S-box protein, partial [Deltaproteobacteria bacterium]|nr:PAS domain S-box protein [Deltaproteobacteria bacterium]